LLLLLLKICLLATSSLCIATAEASMPAEHCIACFYAAGIQLTVCPLCYVLDCYLWFDAAGVLSLQEQNKEAVKLAAGLQVHNQRQLVALPLLRTRCCTGIACARSTQATQRL
jgi:hypothetical protein